MKTTTASRPVKATPAKAKDRRISLLALLDTGAGLFQVTERKSAARVVTDRYFFAPMPSDYGTAYKVEKHVPATETEPAGLAEPYHVCLDGEHSSCECLGYLNHGHCRHIEGLSALRDAGKLTCRKPAPCRHENVFQADGDEIVCADCGASL